MLFCSGNDELSCAIKLQPDIDAFVEWTRIFKLRINTSKTTSMTFSNIKCEHVQLKICGVPLVDKSEHCYIVLCHGKYIYRLYNIIEQAELKLRVLKYHRRNFCAVALRQMYLSYIRPILEYSSPVWVSINCGKISLLESVNLAALRAITGCKTGTSHNSLY